MRHYTYSKIGQFRNAVKAVKLHTEYQGKDLNGDPIYKKTVDYPTVRFIGTVKLHGTNAAICYNPVDGIYCQSRENIITPEEDNARFAFYVETHKAVFAELMKEKYAQLELTDETLIVYGEWCGQGIQSGCAIHQLEKMFVVFGVKVGTVDEEANTWQDPTIVKSNEDIRMFNVFDFKTYELDIDFERPEIAQNKLVDIVAEIEAQCPVGKHFGVEGIGEGAVFTSEDQRYKFKVKGEKHSVSKVKSPKKIEIDPEKQNSIAEFIEYSCTVSRLEQMLEKVLDGNDISRKFTGAFIKGMIGDIMAEEMDVIVVSGLTPDEIVKPVTKFVKNWFFKREEEDL